MDVDCDDELLAAEIVRLKLELEATLQQSKEFKTDDLDEFQAKSPQMSHDEDSQIHFVDEEVCFKYTESDDDCSGDAMMSYDEITVDTAEFMLFDKQQSPEQQRPVAPSRTPSQLESLLQSTSPQRQRPFLYDAEPIVENTDLLHESELQYDDRSYISYDEVTVETADLFTELSLLDRKEVEQDTELDQLRHLLIDHIALKSSVKSPNPSELMPPVAPNDTIEPEESVIDASGSLEVSSSAALVFETDIVDKKESTEATQPCESQPIDALLPVPEETCSPVFDSQSKHVCMDDTPNSIKEASRYVQREAKVEIEEAAVAESVVQIKVQDISVGNGKIEEPDALSIDEEIRLMQEQMLKSPWPSPTKKQSSLRRNTSNSHQLRQPFDHSPQKKQSPKNECSSTPEKKSRLSPEKKHEAPIPSIPVSPTLVSPMSTRSVESPPKKSPKVASPRSTPVASTSKASSPQQKLTPKSRESRASPVAKSINSPTHRKSPPAIPKSPTIVSPVLVEQKESPKVQVQTKEILQCPEPQHASLTTDEYPASPAKSKKTKKVRVRRVRKKGHGNAHLDDSSNNAIEDLTSPIKESKTPISRSPKETRMSDAPLNRMQLPSNLLSEIRLQKNDSTGVPPVHETSILQHVDVAPAANNPIANEFSHTKSDPSTEIQRPPPMFSLLGAIENAATKRVQRLEETGGELIMQDIAPEVEAKQSKNPQLSTSMAEMISQRAAARDKRLADGGEKRMRKVVIKEKDEYKKDFSNIVGDAAMMGRLTRLNEYTVEAVAQPKKPEEEWKSNGLLAIQWKSAHMSVIHDAAAAGNAFKMPEHVVSNFPEENDDALYNEAMNQRFSDRMKQLLLLDEKVGEGLRKVDSLVDGLKEQKPKLNSLLIKPMQSYGGIEDVQLPRKQAPKINPARNAEKLSKMKREALMSGRPMIDISSNAAEVAWERRARLDRPGSMPKVKEICPCPYCKSASPYQTYAYRELDRKHKEYIQQHRQQRMQQRQEQAAKAQEEQAAREELERQERLRTREERRKLKQAVAEAEAAVAKAMAEVEAAKAKKPPSPPAAAAVHPREVVSSTASKPQSVMADPSPEEAPPKSPPKQEKKPVHAIQDRIGEWNKAQVSTAAAVKYKNQPPPVDAASCKCTIM